MKNYIGNRETVKTNPKNPERRERYPLSVSSIPSVETRIPKGKDKKSRRKDCKDPFAAGASLVRILVCEIRDDGEDLPGAGAGGGTLRGICL